jgi:hypothetical protein
MRRFAQKKGKAEPWDAAPNPAFAMGQLGQIKHLPQQPTAWMTSEASRVRLRPSAHPFGAHPAKTNSAGLRSAAASALALDPSPVRPGGCGRLQKAKFNTTASISRKRDRSFHQSVTD